MKKKKQGAQLNLVPAHPSLVEHGASPTDAAVLPLVRRTFRFTSTVAVKRNSCRNAYLRNRVHSGSMLCNACCNIQSSILGHLGVMWKPIFWFIAKPLFMCVSNINKLTFNVPRHWQISAAKSEVRCWFSWIHEEHLLEMCHHRCVNRYVKDVDLRRYLSKLCHFETQGNRNRIGTNGSK